MGNQQVQLTLSVQDGSLSLGSTMGVTFNSGTNGQGTMTISGTVAAINQALNGLAYTSSGSVSSDTLSISLSDIGGSGPRTTVASVGLQALMWNQGQSFESFGLQNTIAAPVVTLPSGPLPITGTPAPIPGVSVGGAALVNVTLSVQNGVLQVPTTAGAHDPARRHFVDRADRLGHRGQRRAGQADLHRQRRLYRQRQLVGQRQRCGRALAARGFFRSRSLSDRLPVLPDLLLSLLSDFPAHHRTLVWGTGYPLQCRHDTAGHDRFDNRLYDDLQRDERRYNGLARCDVVHRFGLEQLGDRAG